LKKIWLRRGLLLAALIVGGMLFFRWSQESIVTPVFTVTSPDLPEAFDGFRIVQISDLHGKEFGENNSRLIETVAELEPDLIAITGDLIDQEAQLQRVPDLAWGLSALAPTYT
jgi:predicted MPP superfamily phosphohydrolase